MADLGPLRRTEDGAKEGYLIFAGINNNLYI